MSPAAQSIFNRLSKVEMLDLRSASPDRIHWLAHSKFMGDMNFREIPVEDREAVLTDVKTLVEAEYTRMEGTHFGVEMSEVQDS